MENRKTKLEGLLVALVAIAGLVVSIISFVQRITHSVPFTTFILVVLYYIFVFLYGVNGYKKPHGNMVRYLMLILAFYIASSVIVLFERWDNIPSIIFAASNFAAVLIAYMAGRLNKFKKNIVVAVIVTILLLIKSFWPMGDVHLNFYPLFVLDRTMPLFMWATVMLIYFIRYKEHKEAGISADSED
ncbi:MAG: hypothetical protein IJR60_04565 [Eubacterium sp.]|nr:hypothetical protein [Eubacterium sp.]